MCVSIFHYRIQLSHHSLKWYYDQRWFFFSGVAQLYISQPRAKRTQALFFSVLPSNAQLWTFHATPPPPQQQKSKLFFPPFPDNHPLKRPVALLRLARNNCCFLFLLVGKVWIGDFISPALPSLLYPARGWLKYFTDAKALISAVAVKMEFLDPRGNHVLLFFLSLLSCSSFFSSLFLLARLHLSIFLVIYCFIQRSVDVTLAAFANHYSFYYLFFFNPVSSERDSSFSSKHKCHCRAGRTSPSPLKTKAISFCLELVV